MLIECTHWNLQLGQSYIIIMLPWEFLFGWRSSAKELVANKRHALLLHAMYLFSSVCLRHCRLSIAMSWSLSNVDRITASNRRHMSRLNKRPLIFTSHWWYCMITFLHNLKKLLCRCCGNDRKYYYKEALWREFKFCAYVPILICLSNSR